MKTSKKVISFLLCIVPFLAISQQTDIKPDAQQILNKSNRNFFIENKGQWPKEVKYLARLSGMNAWITDAGVLYDYYQIYNNNKSDLKQNLPQNKKTDIENKFNRIKGQVVSINTEGLNKNAKAIPSGQFNGYFNYFIGNDAGNWASFVHLFNEVLVQDVYPGISIRYYFDKGLIRYDYIVKPGADLTQINLNILGSDGYNINNKGELTLETSVGKIFHGKLYAYQQFGNTNKEVSCSFIKNRNGSIGINTENYNHALALVIDPLIYSTFIGGFDNEKAASIAVDINDFAYITGYTESTDYPTVLGSYDVSHNGYKDIFITKLSTTGSGLEYSTFMGGSGTESATQIAVDTNGNAYLTGYTESSNFPTTSLAYEVTNKGGSDVFVTILNSSGGTLDYSTYIGGSSDDRGNAIAFDSIGNIYITGFTESANYPTISSSFDITHNGLGDVFVTKFDPYYGYVLSYSTFLGGTGFDNGTSIALDANGNVFVTGYTESSNYPTKFGSYDRTFNGVWDVFVTELDAIGSNLIYSTFIGGASTDNAYSIAIDNAGNAYITGYTESATYPITAGVYDATYNGYFDAFVTKLNASGSTLVYSTFIGGSNDDICNSIFADKKGYAIFTGSTSSTNYPSTSGAYDATFNGSSDVFISKLNSNGTNLLFSTFIGGADDESTVGIAMDGFGSAYVAGSTTSANYPTSSGTYDRTLNLGFDLFVSKILPINQALAISVSNITTSQANCSWTKGNGTKRAVFILKSDSGIASPVNFTTYFANKTFGIGSKIGTSGWYCVYNDTGSSVLISGLLSNTTYRLMVCEYIGAAGYEFYNNDAFPNNPVNFTTVLVTPTLQAKNIAFDQITNSSFRINCKPGNGANRVIFVKSGSFTTSNPQNKIAYTADTNFGLGTQLNSSGWYCVYNDTGRTVSVSKLTANTIYQVFVFDYNGSSGKEQYNCDTAAKNPSYQLTKFKTPDLQATNIIITANTAGSLTAKWTKGNGSTRAVFVSALSTGLPLPLNNTKYLANDSFSLGSQIGSSGWYCVYNDTGRTVKINKLLSNTIYRIFVCEYNGITSKEQYDFDSAIGNPINQMTSYPSPSIQASNLVFSSVSSDSLKLKWTNGNGSHRLVFATDYNTNPAIPINNITYNANSSFSLGSQIGSSGWFCVYNGTSDSLTISGLSAFTTYRFMVCEYNGPSSMEQYLITTATNNPANKTTDYARPSIQASNIIFSNITPTSAIYNYNRGNGSFCIIMITEGTTPYPPLMDNTTYPISSQIGTSGWYCKYNGNLNPTSLTGLHSANWRMMICEYNGTAGSEKYNTDTAAKNPNSFTNVGISDPLAKIIKVFPNPSNGIFTIDNARNYYSKVYNSLGEEIFSDLIKNDNYHLDLKDVSDGIYFLKLENDAHSINQMIILKR